jgi:hypothetical protein
MVHVATFVIPWAFVVLFLFTSLPLSAKNHYCIAKNGWAWR